MAKLLLQFEDAKKNVEPSKHDKDNASKAHLEVRELLEGSSILSDYGIDTILIGSYARGVSIRRIKDVDVFSKLPDLPDNTDPRKLLKTFSEILTGGFGDDRVELQDRSIKVIFPSYDLDVDVVPARPKNSHWEIPDRTERGGGWEETNPEHLGDLTTEMNDHHDGLYVPLVKLIRQTRRAHLNEHRPGGFYFEIITYHAFTSGKVSNINIARSFCDTLDILVSLLDSAIDKGLPDPSLPGKDIIITTTRDEMETALQVFRTLASKASEALNNEDRCMAAKQFREILGRNGDNEYVFPIPPDCNEDGTKKVAPIIIAGDRHVPPGDRPFA